MGSHMHRQILKNVLNHLVSFEKAPKELTGRQVTEWFRSGERTLEALHELGISAAWQPAAVRGLPEVREIISKVTKNQNWLQTFLSSYPTLRLDLDGGCSPARVCRVRSGLELLLRGFRDVDTGFDDVLRDLEQLGEVDEFDEQLKVWVETGHRPEFFPGDRHPGVPSSHWWWF